MSSRLFTMLWVLLACGVAYAVPIGGAGNGGETIKRIVYPLPTTATVTANAATIDWANGDSQVVNLQGATGTVTITMSNPLTTSMLLKIIQGDQLGTVVFSPVIHTAAGAALTAITGTDDAVDYIMFWYDGAAYAKLGHTQDVKVIP